MKIIYQFRLWRLKRMMIKANSLDHQMDRLAELIQIMEGTKQ